ncbi:ATP-binding response regulator [Noviherbaspirillum massiliense]|uniref:ATP-binding response regulator n=1 Tax=Noviherbaspirillum massiliense TaxID=1465823 RepID=UPI00037FC800|nr:response regulator [Noviherbaspirillum massiliense]
MFTPRVLIVNDDAASVLALSSILASDAESEGFQIITARSGEEALRQVLIHEFAVILLDVSMPGMDGFETAEAIHTHPRSASTPIIFVTAHYADEMNRLKGYQKGAVDYLFTPVIPQILRNKVQAFVELAKKNLQLQRQKMELEALNRDLMVQREQDLEHINERKLAEEALRRSQEELRQLASYQERIKEDERKRIAREIHDELGQNLLALRIDISLLHARTGNTHPKLNQRVNSLLEQIDSTMKSMRAIINNLRPTVLDLGLSAAIEWQVKEFQRRSGIRCELQMCEADLVLDDERATALFRILQESLNNVLRHAQATQTRIELYKQDDRLFMSVEDNGVGFFPGDQRKSKSFGLVGIKERIATLGGEFSIANGPGYGTTLSVSIPLRPEDEVQNREVVDHSVAIAADIAKIARNVTKLEVAGKGTSATRKRKELPASKSAG